MIWFNSEKARHRLMIHGVVITCRTRRKQYGLCNAYYNNKKGKQSKIGLVYVEKLEETVDVNLKNVTYRTHKEAMKEHLRLSGFESQIEWEDEVLRLNKKNRIPSYLVFLKVTLKDLIKNEKG